VKKGTQLLFYVLIALMLVSMFRLFSAPPTDEIPYSDFKTLVTEKKVQDLIISRDHIR
jgi:ATP-dependent Zn protease